MHHDQCSLSFSFSSYIPLVRKGISCSLLISASPRSFLPPVLPAFFFLGLSVGLAVILTLLPSSDFSSCCLWCCSISVCSSTFCSAIMSRYSSSQLPRSSRTNSNSLSNCFRSLRSWVSYDRICYNSWRQLSTSAATSLRMRSISLYLISSTFLSTICWLSCSSPLHLCLSLPKVTLSSLFSLRSCASSLSAAASWLFRAAICPMYCCSMWSSRLATGEEAPRSDSCSSEWVGEGGATACRPEALRGQGYASRWSLASIQSLLQMLDMIWRMFLAGVVLMASFIVI